MKHTNLLLLLLLFVFCVASARAGEECLSNLAMEDTHGGGLRHIPRVDGRIKVDGVIDESLWSEALAVSLDIETRPGENVEPPTETIVHVAENGSHLLVAFDAKDPDPARIRAYLRDRDRAWKDDMVGITVDTFNDERFAFEFFSNPLGADEVAAIESFAG